MPSVTGLRMMRRASGSLLLASLLAALPHLALAQSPSPAPVSEAPPPAELTVVAAYPAVVVDPGDAASFAIASGSRVACRATTCGSRTACTSAWPTP